MSADTVPTSVCGLCHGLFAAQDMGWDEDTQMPVCKQDKKLLVCAVAILKQPADGKGHPINIKGCYEKPDAPDNLL